MPGTLESTAASVCASWPIMHIRSKDMSEGRMRPCPTLFSARCRPIEGTPISDCAQVHEYLNFEGTKLSKSRGTAVEVPYFLSKYDPDPLRFYLTATAPETRDTEPTLRAPKGYRGRISSSATTLSRAEAQSLGKGQAKKTSWWRHIRYAQCMPGATPERTRVRPRRLGFMLSFATKRFDGVVPEPGDRPG
jgi:hypothetical protein